MSITLNNYNVVTKLNLDEFKNREIMYKSTGASNLDTENIILTLENERVFYDKMQSFFSRMKKSDKINNYDFDTKCTLFYKFLRVFLNEHKNIKEVEYIYKTSKLESLIEASIILCSQELNHKI